MNKEYVLGTPLKENEYVLKIADDGSEIKTGFITKLTQKGALPKAFDEWRETYYNKTKLPVYLHTEEFKPGWKLHKWRFGQSQNWATLIHPDGFTLEIYLKQFLEIIQTHIIVHGVIQGEFKWEANKLIKK